MEPACSQCEQAHSLGGSTFTQGAPSMASIVTIEMALNQCRLPEVSPTQENPETTKKV
jgi:hypothetical protein